MPPPRPSRARSESARRRPRRGSERTRSAGAPAHASRTRRPSSRAALACRRDRCPAPARPGRRRRPARAADPLAQVGQRPLGNRDLEGFDVKRRQAAQLLSIAAACAIAALACRPLRVLLAGDRSSARRPGRPAIRVSSCMHLSSTEKRPDRRYAHFIGFDAWREPNRWRARGDARRLRRSWACAPSAREVRGEGGGL